MNEEGKEWSVIRSSTNGKEGHFSCSSPQERRGGGMGRIWGEGKKIVGGVSHVREGKEGKKRQALPPC